MEEIEAQERDGPASPPTDSRLELVGICPTSRVDDARDGLEAPTGAANAPVIALISRLPLPLLDEDG